MNANTEAQVPNIATRGWIARRADGTMDANGARLAYFDGETYWYIGAAFSVSA